MFPPNGSYVLKMPLVHCTAVVNGAMSPLNPEGTKTRLTWLAKVPSYLTARHEGSRGDGESTHTFASHKPLSPSRAGVLGGAGATQNAPHHSPPQRPLRRALGALQAAPETQSTHVPPQSMSLSLPSRTPFA